MRASSEYLDGIIEKNISFNVLDEGFIRVIDYMGNDAAIVQAARVSYGEGTKTLREDEGLIAYLMEHAHTSPFEMCSLKIHVKMPIFIARQWIRHRTASLNEYSGRYSEIEDSFYIPAAEYIKKQDTTNKQGSGEDLPEDVRESAAKIIADMSSQSHEKYLSLLEMGVSREMARVVITPNVYTQMYWKIDLHNLLHFIRLRADSHAQFEIRQYAQVLLQIIEGWLPMTHKAFVEFKQGAVTLPKTEMAAIRDGEIPQGLTKRRAEALAERFPHLRHRVKND